jgi:hypothetical protein
MTELSDIDLLTRPRGSLIDYAMVNAEDPNLFSAMPSSIETAALKPKQGVKIGIEGDNITGSPHPEHFWVEIVERRGIKGFVGKVANDLQPEFGLKYGDLILFAEHHIRAIQGA